jgi:tetratricopeptide (TPR) repeat protein
MRRIKTLIHLQDFRTIYRGLPTLPLQILALAAVIFTGIATVRADAGQAQVAVASGGQVVTSYVNDDENNAYYAAKSEPDPQKRAMKLFEFVQKYPKSQLTEQSDYEAIRTIEDEYNAYYSAKGELDFEKRSARLIEFLQKYPKSALSEQVDYEYSNMLKELYRGGKYELLGSLGERWLKIRPNDRETYAFVAEAAMNLQKYEKCGEYLEAIYKMQPSTSLAKEIFLCYEKTENLPKQGEWMEILLKMPEFDDDYMLRYGYMMRFYKEKNLPKAAEYAQLTLKSADLAKRSDARMQEQLRQVRRACYDVIASNLWENGQLAEAVSAFKKAIKAERYAQGYYKIGLCLDSEKDIDEALLYYAMAELMGGEDAPRAKARLEVLYRALHNDTLVGVDKVYNKGKELLAETNN